MNSSAKLVGLKSPTTPTLLTVPAVVQAAELVRAAIPERRERFGARLPGLNVAYATLDTSGLVGGECIPVNRGSPST